MTVYHQTGTPILEGMNTSTLIDLRKALLNERSRFERQPGLDTTLRIANVDRELAPIVAELERRAGVMVGGAV